MAKSTTLKQLRQARDGERLEQESASAGNAVMPSVGLYARISDAWESELGEITTAGVDRQRQDGERLAQVRGWTIARAYVDNDRSAFKDTVIREQFEALAQDLADGTVDGIVCYDLDRFARRPDDLERVIKVYDKGRAAGRTMYFASVQGDIDLQSDSGITMARVMVAFANKASRDTARRVARKHRANRDEGRVVSGRRAFGWDIADGGQRVINDAEAGAIRWAIAGLTAGNLSWRDVVREWNGRGLLTVTGRAWQPVTVKQALRSPRLAGYVTHESSFAVHSETGLPIKATNLEPILTDDEFEAFLVAIETPEGGAGSGTASGRRKYLLAGLARCTECGGRMVGNANAASRGGFVYRCDTVTCAKANTAGGAALDELVTAEVLSKIIAESKRMRFVETSPHAVARYTLSEERRDLNDRYRDGEVPADVALPRLAELDVQLEKVRHADELHRLTQRQLHGEVITRTGWSKFSTDEQRVHVARHVEAVYVRPMMRRTGNRFDADRVNIVPKPKVAAR
jgi:DNA invertase Pin-like site-specific DNA recombinase